VTMFYCLGALNNERRERSILFWKSLPVSDLTTVLSKAFIPIVVMQLLSFAITVATQAIMVLINSAVLLGTGPGVSILWTQLGFFHRSILLFYHLMTVHALWYAPIYCWFLLVSGWARRAAFLWAFLPPLAMCVGEKILFNSWHIANFLKERLSGGAEAVTLPGTMPMDLMTHVTLGRFLSSPGLWLGLMVAAMFLAAAARLRRYREPI
jgi:ABC-2 type transport system permease protein